MKIFSHKICVFALLIIFYGQKTFAYIPPASFILREASKAHDTVKTLFMEGKVTDLRSHATVKELLQIDFNSGRLSASYSNETSGEEGYESNLKSIHRLGKFWLIFGLDSNLRRINQTLEELNVLPSEKTEVKLQKIGTQVNWAWGENPIIHILKDDFLAAAYLSSGANGTTAEEIWISEYTASAIRVPKTLFFRVQGKDTFRFDIKTAKINQKLKFNPNSSLIKSEIAKEWVMLVR